MTSILDRPDNLSTDEALRRLLLPVRPDEKVRHCGAIIHKGHVYFGQSVDVTTLVELHSDKTTRYCTHVAHYEVSGDVACDEHLINLMKDKVGQFADSRVAVQIF